MFQTGWRFFTGENLFLEVPGLEGHCETHNLTILINCQMIALCDIVLYNEAFRFMHKNIMLQKMKHHRLRVWVVVFFSFWSLILFCNIVILCIAVVFKVCPGISSVNIIWELVPNKDSQALCSVLGSFDVWQLLGQRTLERLLYLT